MRFPVSLRPTPFLLILLSLPALATSIIVIMHACLACNYPKALSHCDHGHDLTSAAKLAVVNMLTLEVLSLKHWHQSAFAEMLSTGHIIHNMKITGIILSRNTAVTSLKG